MLTTSEQLAELSDDELKARAYENASVQLTDQQQALIAWNSRVQTRRSMRTYRRNAIVGFLVLLAGLGATRYMDVQQLNQSRQAVVDSGNAIVVDGCNRDFETARRQREALYKQPQRSGRRLTEAEKNRIVRQLTPLPDCREVRNALTDNPEKRVTIPPALHEGLVNDQGKLEKRGREDGG